MAFGEAGACCYAGKVGTCPLGLGILSLLLPLSHDPVRPRSDQLDGKRFYNPTLPQSSGPTFSDISKVVPERRTKWPSSVPNVGIPRLREQIGADDVDITFLNHATFLIQIQRPNILTGPIWSKRA